MKAPLLVLLAAAAAAALAPSHAFAGANGFTLVNQSGNALTGLQVRRTGTSAWQSLAAGVSTGASTKVSFTDPDCAFDLKASLGGGAEAVWRGVNLCEVSSVTLRRDAAGSTWVEYD